MIDANNQNATTTVIFGASPRDASTVTVVDAASGNTTSTVNAGIGPQALAVNMATNQIYVANYGDGVHASTVTVINGAPAARRR